MVVGLRGWQTSAKGHHGHHHHHGQKESLEDHQLPPNRPRKHQRNQSSKDRTPTEQAIGEAHRQGKSVRWQSATCQQGRGRKGHSTGHPSSHTAEHQPNKIRTEGKGQTEPGGHQGGNPDPTIHSALIQQPPNRNLQQAVGDQETARNQGDPTCRKLKITAKRMVIKLKAGLCPDQPGHKQQADQPEAAIGHAGTDNTT